MNKYIKASMVAAVAAVSFTACEDLDVENKSRFVTTDQKEATLQINPDRAEAGIAGISSSVNQYMSIFGNHFDFGYASTMLGLDLQGMDMVGDYNGYNWFRYWSGFTSPSPNGTPSTECWYTMFKQVYACNTVLESLTAEVEEPVLMFYRAQALTSRAFDYWVLAQLYQFNYAGNESKPCVPLVLTENAQEVAANGAPRATVQEVYDQILKDINEAIELLSKAGLEPSDVMDAKPKRYASLATAYGMRARVYLTMHKYAEAANDADQAIANFKGSVRSINEAAHPGFSSIDESDWMWGIPVNESDRVVTSGIVNWPSHMNTFTDGYTTVGAWRFANVALYDAIPASDVRKGWFLDENLKSANLNSLQQRWVDGQSTPCFPYTNVKFAGYLDGVGVTNPANDIPLMRIEEMYLIKAEGLAMSGQTSAAVDFLNNFVQTYRNKNYSCNATTPEDIQQEVYFQRRVELWGEGLSYFDIMRLDLVINRLNLNWAPQESFVIPNQASGSDRANVRIYCIPEGEINGNKALSATDNNPSHVKPDPTWTEIQ